MKWHSLQRQAANAISAATSLAGVMVIEDNGTIEKTVERQLADVGTAIIVSMPESIQPTDHGPKLVNGDAMLAVEVHQNPTKNASRAVPRNLVEDIGEMVLAMILTPGHTAQSGQLGFRLQDLTMVNNEPGLIVYAAIFSIRCTLSPKP